MPLSDYPIRFAPTVNCEQDQGGTDQGRAESGRLRRSDERRTEKAPAGSEMPVNVTSVPLNAAFVRIDIELRAADFEAVKDAVLAVISNAEYVCERQGTRVLQSMAPVTGSTWYNISAAGVVLVSHRLPLPSKSRSPAVW